MFADVTAAAGIDDMGISFGASAGDFDGDGDVDIFTSGHYSAHPRLWRNDGNGSFTDVVQWLQPVPTGDLHAAQWVDLDNDGGQELVLSVGANYGMGASPKYVYRRYGAQWSDVAVALGLDVPLMRGRMPLALDQNNDGLLDLFLAALFRPDGQAPPSLFQQEGGVFLDRGPSVNFALPSGTTFGVLGDLDGDQKLDALFDSARPSAWGIQDPVVNLTGPLGLTTLPGMSDAVVADFTGDGENEIYAARFCATSSFRHVAPRVVEFCAYVDGAEHAVRFGHTAGEFTWFDFTPFATFPLAAIHVGESGYQPISFRFPLVPSDPTNWGIAPHAPGQDAGVWLGWDPTEEAWTVAFSSPIWAVGMLRTISSGTITVPTAEGFDPNAAWPSDRLYTRVAGQYVDATAGSGIPANLRGCSAVAADFDNDMDLDLYVVTTTASHNTPNVMLENLGDGTFAPVPAGPAEGSPEGIGDVAITLDYDRDGWLDLFLVNGGGGMFLQPGTPGAFADDGPAQLLRNITPNGNHWLGIELVGTGSNRDGIGARIVVTAGGVTQVREHSGGMHRFAQNHGIHFGLGPNAIATQVEVSWPSGRHSVLVDVAADQYLTIIE